MPRNRGRRERVETGIYRDAVGFAVVQTVGKVQREERHPAGTSRQALRDARAALRAALLKEAKQRARGAPARGTLAAAAVDYLAAVKGMASFGSRRSQIEKWVAVFGRRRLADVSHLEIAQQLQRWRTEPRGTDAAPQPPYSAQYVIHLRNALSHLYQVVAPGSENPVALTQRERPPELLPRAVPVAAVLRILRAYPLGSKTKARQAVMVTTGLGQTELMRLRPDDVRLAAGVLIARARRKGKGSAPRTIPLTRHARRALWLFARLDCWGPFHTSNMRRDFRQAAERAGFDLRSPQHPDGLDWRPYDARHTFLTVVGLVSRDERAVQEIAGHSDRRTTARYTLGSVDPRVAAAMAALDGKERVR